MLICLLAGVLRWKGEVSSESRMCFSFLLFIRQSKDKQQSPWNHLEMANGRYLETSSVSISGFIHAILKFSNFYF